MMQVVSWHRSPQPCISKQVNTMLTDELMAWGTRASAAKVLTQFSCNILISTLEGLIYFSMISMILILIHFNHAAWWCHLKLYIIGIIVLILMILLDMLNLRHYIDECHLLKIEKKYVFENKLSKIYLSLESKDLICWWCGTDWWQGIYRHDIDDTDHIWIQDKQKWLSKR